MPIKVLGMGMPIIQSGWSHDRPNFIRETSIHVRPVFILVHHRVYSADVKAGIRTSITKLDQSWDRLNFIMGIPITSTLLWVRSQKIVIGKLWFYWNRKLRPTLVFGGYQLEMFTKVLYLMAIYIKADFFQWAQMRPSTLELFYNLKKITSKW